MFDESKMYAVIGVLLIILLGLFVYLITIDLKVRRLEKQSRKEITDSEAAINNQEKK